MDDVDFAFAWEGAAGAAGPWQHLRVISIRGREAIGSLYRYEVEAAVIDPDPEPDPDEMVGTRATLRITTRTDPAYRLVHGIITEAEEMGPLIGLATGSRYRVVISPPIARAAHRVRSRIFLEKSTRQIIDSVLQGDSGLSLSGGVAEPANDAPAGFSPASASYAWRVTNASRIDDATTRPYCVQYNESDLAFVSRLLEEEGIGYHFENGEGACIMVLADSDSGRTRLSPFKPLGPEIQDRWVTTLKLGARLRPRKVTLLEYNWKKPALSMTADAPGGTGDLTVSEYPGLYPDTPAQGLPLAAAKLDRYGVEASYAVGDGPCRLLSAGAVFSVEHPKTRYDGEYLVTQIEVSGSQSTLMPVASDVIKAVPFFATFECARRGKGMAIAESHFRPARVTPKPRIVGSQTAFVTAAPSAAGAEIHIGGPAEAEIGCVRVKFHWDTESGRHAGEPTSCWVRVNQVFAGLGQGSVFHPRVGVEVIVDFEDGDPDRPLVVGRVYNGQNQPSTVVPSISTFKTDTTPGGGSHNELRFDDTAGAQQILLHTPKDWNSEVGNDRSEQVAVNSTSSVGALRNELTGADRTTTVGANNTETIAANETITVGANQTLTVGADQDVGIEGDQSIGVVGNRSVGVEGNESIVVEGNQDVAVLGMQTIGVKLDRLLTVEANLNEAILKSRRTAITLNDDLAVSGDQNIVVTKTQRSMFQADHEVVVGKNETIGVTGNQNVAVTGNQTIAVTGDQSLSAKDQSFSADQDQTLSSTKLSVSATDTAALGAPTVRISGDDTGIGGKTLTIVFSGDINIKGKTVTIDASTLTLNGNKVTMGGGSSVDIQAALIKLN